MIKKPYLFSISSHPDAIHINPLNIKFYKPDVNFKEYDYFIITSKQSSKALSQYEKKVFKDKKALCISIQSAKSFESLGGSVLEVGSGYGDDLTSIIKKYPKDTKWLYLRAKEVASDFFTHLKEIGYNLDTVIMYESSCSKEIEKVSIQKEDTLIFTSPSSVKCYLKSKNITKSNFIIVIGETTAKALPLGINYVISDKKTIQSCLNLLKRYKYH